ncbi:alkaline phosphatase family protein [Pseudarthrobacter sp. P1]|uniref:alkaline phosphatase family protein n=1 Tax=Pseudarthrobacter sp. P1 TaxID=3418418 RepID=UPI003CF78C8F
MTKNAAVIAPHLLVVGIDGVRFDTLAAAHTPALDTLAASGVLLPVQVHEKNPTVSGPVWSTVATGVYSDKHGVLGNDIHPETLRNYPDFLQMLRESVPGTRTMVAASWYPIAGDHGCGPIFSSRGWLPALDMEAQPDVPSAAVLADDDGVEYSSARLAVEDITAAFIYLGEPDEFAHYRGTGQGYIRSIERCDARLGRLLETIDARPGRAHEAWTVIVVTDHGHVDNGGHGGDSTEERTAWMAAAGPGIGAHIGQLCHADIAAHAGQIFGLDVAELDGVPFGRR